MRIIWDNGGSALYAQIMEELVRTGHSWQKNTVIYSSHYFSNYNWKKVVKLPVNTML